MEIRVLHRRGMSIRAIARELKMSRKTVRKYLRDPSLEPVYRTWVPRPSKLDPYKPYLAKRISEAAPRKLPATVYLREIKERGYEGGITLLKLWLADQYPKQPAPEIIRFETLIDRNAYGPGQHRFHAGFREFAKHHGLSPRICAPYRAQTKGKVERFIQYLKRSFVWPLESRLKGQGIMLDADIANAYVDAWLRDVANSRIHAETKAQPIERFAQEAAHF